jgi:putative ABC transport system substrate-binding protein
MKGSQGKHLSAFACTVLTLLCLAGRTYGDIRIAVLMSDSLTATMRTLHGAANIITQKHPEASLHTFLISQRPEGLRRVIDSVKAIGPTVVLTIGSPATKCAQENFADVPIVFAAVKNPELSGFIKSADRPGKNITGASIDVPTSVQFAYFKRIVPGLTRVGVLYTDSTAALIPGAKAEAKRLDMTLIAIKVADVKELPVAMDSLAASVEGIWSLADPNLFDPQSTRYILLNTLRKGIPFMGFSRNVVESGALFALDFDYKAVGQQAGGIVNRIMNGEKPEDIRVTSADVIWFHYNEKTAQHINVKIPEELAAVAKEVYR